jgi:hypothetical protein
MENIFRGKKENKIFCTGRFHLYAPLDFSILRHLNSVLKIFFILSFPLDGSEITRFSE